MWKKLGYILTKKEIRHLIILMFAVVIGSLLELAGVSIFMPFINIIMDTNSIYETPYLNYVYNLFRFNDSTSFIVALTGGIIFIYIFKNIFLAVEKNCIYKYSYNIQKRISTGLLKSYMNEPYTFHLNKNVAELQRSMLDDADLFAKGIIHVVELIAEVVVCIMLGVYLFIVSQSITVVVIGLVLICMLIFVVVIKKYIKPIGKNNQIYVGKLYQWINQGLGGIKEIKILNREQYFIDNYDWYFDKYVNGLRINRLMGILPKYLLEAVCMVGLLIAIIVKILFGQKDLIEFLPQLSVFAVAAFRLMPSVGRINEHYSSALYSVPSLELIYNDLKNVENLEEQTADEEISWEFKNSVTLSHVRYHYPDAEEDVLKDINIEINKGGTIAIIGTSGAGKTTLIDVILGLLKPQYGKLYADGMNIEKNLRLWQKEIGYIPQVIYLSDDTIRNNIAFGIPENEINDEAIISALKQAQLYEFVENLPEGLDTQVGDRGVRLSGGQRQRIGIARALYHNPEILVLDEATSALDNETEIAVMEAINSLQGIKTMIIIAHRLTTIKNADIIYEIVDGNAIVKNKDEVLQKGITN